MSDQWTVERNAGHAYGVDYRKYLKLFDEQLRKMATIRKNVGTGANLPLELKVDDDRVQVWISHDWNSDSTARFLKRPDSQLRNGSQLAAHIYILDPDGVWVNVETFRPNHFQIPPWGGDAERVRTWPHTSLRALNREAWAIEQGWQYPLPYMYGNSSILRCLNGHLQTESITLMNSLDREFGIKDVDFIGMNRSASRICGCDAVLEDWCFDPLGMDIYDPKYPDLHIAPGTAHAFSINADDHRYYHWEFLNALPTLHSGQFSNLKIQTKRVKVWLLRGDEARVFIDIADERGDWHTVHDYVPRKKRPNRS